MELDSISRQRWYDSSSISLLFEVGYAGKKNCGPVNVEIWVLASEKWCHNIYCEPELQGEWHHPWALLVVVRVRVISASSGSNLINDGSSRTFLIANVQLKIFKFTVLYHTNAWPSLKSKRLSRRQVNQNALHCNKKSKFDELEVLILSTGFWSKKKLVQNPGNLRVSLSDRLRVSRLLGFEKLKNSKIEENHWIWLGEERRRSVRIWHESYKTAWDFKFSNPAQHYPSWR